MNQTTFHWQATDETPELLMMVGAITLTWSRIDDQITQMLLPFWFDDRPTQGIPRSFDRRIGALVEIVSPLYANEPDELRQFQWYVQRLRNANGQRDQIAHGIPGTITKNGRTFWGLVISFPSRETKYISKSIASIEKLVKSLYDLHFETVQVHYALIALRNASSGNVSTWKKPGGWTPVTMENRSPKLPRLSSPPPTFHG